MAYRNPTSSKFTLKISAINTPIKSLRLAEWIIKYDPTTCCLQTIHFRFKDIK